MSKYKVSCDDWQTEPMPETHAVIPFDRMYSRKEMEKIQRGLLPLEMEDKWFICFEDDTLRLHRSWTGFCVYQARFVEQPDGWVIDELLVNRDPEQYTATDNAYDAALFEYIVESLLLSNYRFPFPEKSNGEGEVNAALARWSLMGRNASADELNALRRGDDD